MNDWSFSQLCRFAGVGKDTVNRVSADTASRIFFETLPSDGKPLQALTNGENIRAIHPASYTRLFNADLLTMVRRVRNGLRAATTGWSSQHAADGSR